MAQLEDQLTVANEDIQSAFKSVKPSVNISTGSPITAGGAVGGKAGGAVGGAVQLSDPSLGIGIGVASAVAGVLGLGWLLLKRK